MRPVTGATSKRRINISLTILSVVLAGAGGFLLLQPRRASDRREEAGFQAHGKKGVPWLKNVADKAGIAFRHDRGHVDKYLMPEILAGGVGLIDFDRDGFLDVYFLQGGSIAGPRENRPGNQLFRNRRDGTFEDVTVTAGVGDRGFAMGCCCADFDNDGWTDMYVTNVGPNVLYRNNGDGTFSDVTVAAGVGDPGFSSSAAAVDYDRDGNLDIFVVNYLHWSVETEVECAGPRGNPGYCVPLAYAAPAPDTLYRNRGDGTFDDMSESAGLRQHYGNGLGVVCADLTHDGFPEILVANDLLANQLWINQGNGTFVDEALERGFAYNHNGVAEAGMGIDTRDLDADGDLDAFLTHFVNQTNTVYVNQGSFFVDASARYGMADSLPYTGFGTALIDLNNDGTLDTYVANGRVLMGQRAGASVEPYAEPNQLFEGLPEGGFREVLPRGGTTDLLVHSSRGAAFGDYDNDGDIDLFVANNNGPPYVLNNRAGVGNHWIEFRVLNRHGSDAIGARVEIETGGKRRVQEVRAAYGYCASNDPRVHFGLGSVARVDSVQVVWVDGTADHFGAYDADRIVDLRR